MNEFLVRGFGQDVSGRCSLFIFVRETNSLPALTIPVTYGQPSQGKPGQGALEYAEIARSRAMMALFVQSLRLYLQVCSSSHMGGRLCQRSH